MSDGPRLPRSAARVERGAVIEEPSSAIDSGPRTVLERSILDPRGPQSDDGRLACSMAAAVPPLGSASASKPCGEIIDPAARSGNLVTLEIASN
jgi:hypothetical protein